jgi:cytochrome c oxidase subunit 1
MWRGSMTFETPMLFSIAFVILFTIGGFSGLMLTIAPADYQYHDTYFVVAHFHYVLIPGALFTIIAAVYYWLPKWCGRMYDESLGKLHFWLSFVGVNVTFFRNIFRAWRACRGGFPITRCSLQTSIWFRVSARLFSASPNWCFCIW